MAKNTHFALSQLLSELISRDVSFSPIHEPAESKDRFVYGTYVEVDTDRTLVIKAELAGMGILAGALLGLPDDSAAARALENPMNESIRDAIHEVLNITSTALTTTHRVVFKTMATDPVYCTTAALQAMKNPDDKNCYKMSVNGQGNALFSVYTGA